MQHERLPDARTAEKTKAYWRERMAALKTLLEGGISSSVRRQGWLALPLDVENRAAGSD